MRPWSMPRRRAAFPIALALLLAPSAAPAHEIDAVGAARGIVVHDAAETLRDYCRRDAAGRLWLEIPGGARFELVTSTADPVIANPGDGSFHPFDLAEVRAALSEVRFPLAGVSADVFILPYPRRHGLSSAAGHRLILLSPGVRPIPRGQQHAEFVHELGHVVQRALLPDHDAAGWEAYRALRGIDDPAYSAAAPHADRPHEIFAEDFRVLFGGATADPSGTVENPRIRSPRSVPGLDRFLLGLAGPAAPGPDRLTASREPGRAGLRFARAGIIAAPLDLYDVAGRRLATLEPAPVAGGVEWRWDGRGAGAGVVFARVRGAAERARVTLLR